MHTTNRTVQLTERSTSVVEIVVTAEGGQTNKTYTISLKRLSSSKDGSPLSSVSLSPGLTVIAKY